MSPAYPQSKTICRCLRVTESQLLEAELECELRTVKEVTQQTGAGGGCMACHCAIRKFLMLQRNA